MLVQCFQVVAGAFPQRCLKISLKKNRGRNYLNREATHPLTQRLAGGDLFFGDHFEALVDFGLHIVRKFPQQV